MPQDPLAALLEHLEDTGEVPRAWRAAHAPDGELGRVWAACLELDALFQTAATCASRQALVSAASACAQTALAYVHPAPSPVVRALELTEAWCRGAATEEAVRAAFEAIEYLEPAVPIDHFARGALWGCARDAVAAAADAVSIEHPAEAAAGAARKARDAIAMHTLASDVATGPLLGDDPRWTAAVAAATPRIAGIVRAHLSCPTLDQLRAALAP